MKRLASYFYLARTVIYFLAGYAAIFSAALISWPYKVWAILGSMAIVGIAYAAGEAVPVDVDDLEKLAREAEQKEAARNMASKQKAIKRSFSSDDDDSSIRRGEDDLGAPSGGLATSFLPEVDTQEDTFDLARSTWDESSPLYQATHLSDDSI